MLHPQRRLASRSNLGNLRPINTVKPILLACVLLLPGLTTMSATLKPIYKLCAAEREARSQADALGVAIHSKGLQDAIRFIATQPEIFPPAKPKEIRLLRREEKEIVWQAWQRFLDYTLALGSTERYHADWWRLKGDAREDSFLISYAAMLANYRAALEFIRAAELNPELDKVLNDAVPELGLPAGTYAKLKFVNLNLRIATEFAASEVTVKTFTGGRRPDLRAAIKADADFIWKTGRGQGELLTVKNALTILQHGAGTAWLPIQAGVSEWMGDTKVYRINTSLVSEKQIHALQPILRPGDVMLVRHEWYLSNVGLPGFWPHATLYIGTPEERREFFNDAATRAWVKQQGETSGDLEALLQTHSPDAYQHSVATTNGRIARVIEAISEGVSLTPLEHALDCDSLVVLRPRLSASEKAQAIFRAFHYVGRPYDFNFDFSTDAELVCTELVYKSFEPANGFTGLKLPTVEMLGRQVTPANEIAKLFDAEYGKPEQQFDFVLFLDGQERAKNAVEASVEEFRASCLRPKWHVLTQR